MRKILFLLVALLFVSVGNAQAWFAADARTTEGAASVKIPVYNNSGSALDEGDVVVWDIGSSTGDNDLYVTTTTTADTGLVAGVVGSGGIASASVGSIIVYGLAQCDVGSGGIAAGGLLCSASTAVGDGDGCASATGEASYAIAGIAGTSDQIECIVRIK